MVTKSETTSLLFMLVLLFGFTHLVNGQTSILTNALEVGGLFLNANTLYIGDSNSGNVYTINALSNSLGPTILTGAGGIHAFAFNPATGTLYTGDVKSVNIYPINILTGSVGSAIASGAPYTSALFFDPATSILYASAGTSNVYPINILTDSLGPVITTNTPHINSFAFDPATSALYVGGWGGSGNVCPINTIDDSVGLTIITSASNIYGLSYDPATSTLYVGDDTSTRIDTINTIDNYVGPTITVSGDVDTTLFDSLTGTLYAGNANSGNIFTVNTLYNLAGPNIVTEAPRISALALDLATSTLYAGDGNSGRVYAIPAAPLSAGTLSSAAGSVIDANQPTTLSTSGASGGITPGAYGYAWTNLPDGCTPSNSPSISCTPADTAGSPFTVTLTVTDGDGETASASMLLKVTTVQITVQPSNSVSMDVGQSIPVNAVATGGESPYTYSYTSSSCGGLSGPANSLTFAPATNSLRLPQYVASFDGSTSSITTGTANIPVGNSPSSFFAWIYVSNAPSNGYVLFVYGDLSTPNDVAALADVDNTLIFYNGASFYYATVPLQLNAWQSVGYAYDGGTTLTLYVDGSPTTYTIPQQNVVVDLAPTIGGLAAADVYFQGLMSDAQFYHSALSGGQVASMYAEGIGGVPVGPANTAGWWPLAGDSNDHSGNGNNGIPTNIVYVVQPNLCTFTFTANDLYTSNTASTAPIMLYPALSAGTISSSAGPVMDANQPTTLSTSGAFGGTGPGTYSYAWTNLPDGCAPSNSPSTSCTPTDAAGSPFTVTLTVTDGNGDAASADTVVTVDPAIQITANPSTSANTEVGYSIPVNALATGGAGSFAYSYTSTGAACAGFATGSANTVIFAPTVSGTCAFTFTARDAYSSNSASTVTITVNYNPALDITANPSSPVTIEVGQSVTVGAVATLGTGMFTYNYISSGCGGLSGSTNSVVFTPSAPESCTFTFTVNDIYTSNSASTATITVNPAPGIGGGIGPSGTGGPSGPAVTKFGQNSTSCHRIANFTRPNSETFALNGTAFTVTASSITPASATLIVNNRTYVLALNQSVDLGSRNNYEYAAKLENISYLPVLHSVDVEVCSMPMAATPSTPANTTMQTTTVPVAIGTTTISMATTISLVLKNYMRTQTAIVMAIIIVALAALVYLHTRRKRKNARKHKTIRKKTRRKKKGAASPR
jgi:hypothetical protein